MNILNIFTLTVGIILFCICIPCVVFIAIDRICRNNEISEDDFNEAFDTSVCKFIDENCFVRDKNCNIIKTHTHIVTTEDGTKKIFIDLKN